MNKHIILVIVICVIGYYLCENKELVKSIINYDIDWLSKSNNQLMIAAIIILIIYYHNELTNNKTTEISKK